VKNIAEILKEAVKKDIITIRQYNDRISVFIVYRIIWETKGHEIVYAFSTEEMAKKAIENKPENEYFYKEVHITTY
jgi:hypothetical protein